MRRYWQRFPSLDSDTDDSSEDASAAYLFPFRYPSPDVDLVSAPAAAAAATVDDDDDVQILTADEAAAAVASAHARGLKRKRPSVETKAEPTECSICCEDCAVSGRHRLVALRCGHLFGKKCIEHWLREKRSCPNCNAVTTRADVIPLFSNHVAVVDNSGVEDATHKYEEEKKKSCGVEKELERLKKNMARQVQDAARLHAEMVRWKNTAIDLRCKLEREQVGSPSQPTATHRLSSARRATTTTSPVRQATMSAWLSQAQLAPSLELDSPERRRPRVAVDSPSHSSLDPGGSAIDAAVRKYKPVIDLPLRGARVFGIAGSCTFVCVGEQLDADKHGILLVNTQGLTCPVTTCAHSSAIRDLCINAKEDLAVSVAFDGKLVITNLKTLGVVMKVSFPPGRRQGWSCALSEDDPFAMYCGFQDGTVAKYDMRKPAPGEQGIVKLFSLPERQPVHSVKLFRSHEGPQAEGLAAATFRGISVWTNVVDVATAVNLPSGSGVAAPPPDRQVASIPPCFSLSSSQLNSNKVVVSSRSRDSTPTMHSLFDLQTIDSGQFGPTAELIGHKAPSVLSRSAIWSEADGTPVVASWSHDIERVTVWDAGNNREVPGPDSTQSAASSSTPVVDIQHVVEGGNWSARSALFGTMTARQLWFASQG